MSYAQDTSTEDIIRFESAIQRYRNLDKATLIDVIYNYATEYRANEKSDTMNNLCAACDVLSRRYANGLFHELDSKMEALIEAAKSR